MSSFSGFSEAEILKLQNGNNTKSTNKSSQENHLTAKKYPAAMQMKANKPAKQDARNKMELENKINTSQSTTLPAEAKLISINQLPSKVEDDSVSMSIISEKVEVVYDTNNHEKKLVTSSENTEILEKKTIDFDEFKLKQKYMEEQNRIRKEQVARALADRTKRTMQEQQKLVAIQDEFKKLDATLSNDVKILRKHIEAASYDYMEAQKRYHQIEKEFLSAKLYLHQKLEKKELLTEHLCAIIEKNEERKADKLNELLQKLDILDEQPKVQDSDVSSNA